MPDEAHDPGDAAELLERTVDNILAGRVAGLAIAVQYADGTSSSHWRWWGAGNAQLLVGTLFGLTSRVNHGVEKANEGTAREDGKLDA